MSFYQHGKRTKRAKNPKVIMHASVVLGVALLGVAFILQRDLSLQSDEKTTVPIITEIKEDDEDTITIDEPLFSLELPTDWELVGRVNESYGNWYEWRSTKPGADDKNLKLHVDIMPRSYKVTRLQPVTVSGSKLSLGNLSGHCISFAEKGTDNGPVPAKWEEVNFICDPIEANQTIGTGTAETGIAAGIGDHEYFFYWTDHNIRPEEKILQNILRSFIVK